MKNIPKTITRLSIFLMMSLATAQAETQLMPYPFPEGKALACKAKTTRNRMDPLGTAAEIITGADKLGNLTIIVIGEFMEANGRSDIGYFWAHGSADKSGTNADYKLLRQDASTWKMIEVAKMTIRNGSGTLLGKNSDDSGGFRNINLKLSECEVR